MTAQDNVTKKKQVLVPPDGGWGYMICVAATINFIAASAFISCYGMIFNDFFAALGMDSTDVMLLTGVNAVSASLASFLSGPLMKVMSMRKLSLLASAVFTVGNFATAFVTSQAMLYFWQGIMQNFGLGVIFNLSCTALNDYFKKKKLFSMSIVNTVTAAAAMLTPLAVEWSNATYGFKGTIFMVTAVGAMSFLGSSLLQPVAWHMKVVDVEVDKFAEIKELLSKLDDDVADETSAIKSNDPEKAVYLFAEQNGSVEDKSSKENKVMALIKQYLDWPLLKGYLSTCTCFAIPMCMFAENTFIVFLAPYLYGRNWSNENVAFLFSLQGFGDIATRVVLIFSNGALKKLGSHLMYVIGLLFGIATKLALLWVSEYKSVLAIVTLSGVSRCTIAVLFPLVVSETVIPELFPLAFGLNMVIFGLSSIILGPLMGFVRDMTNNYETMFYALTTILAVAAVAMVGEVALKRRQSKTAVKQDTKCNAKD